MLCPPNLSRPRRAASASDACRRIAVASTLRPVVRALSVSHATDADCTGYSSERTSGNAPDPFAVWHGWQLTRKMSAPVKVRGLFNVAVVASVEGEAPLTHDALPRLVCSIVSFSRVRALGPSTAVTALLPVVVVARGDGAAGAGGVACCAPTDVPAMRKPISNAARKRLFESVGSDLMFVLTTRHFVDPVIRSFIP